MLLRLVVLTLTWFAVAQSANAFPDAKRLEGVPQENTISLPPGGAVYRNQKFYYTAPDQGDNPITCRGPGDRIGEGFQTWVEWHHCWRKDEKEPYDPDAGPQS